MTGVLATWTPEQAAELRRLVIGYHPRLAVVLNGVAEGLSWEQMAERAQTTVNCVQTWHYEWKFAERGIVPSGAENAWRAAYMVRLTHDLSPSPGLRSAGHAYLLRLREVCPEIDIHTPARPGTLGGHDLHVRPEPPVCPSCNMTHAGECF